MKNYVNIGDLIKDIRTGKSLIQDYVCQNYISRTALSKIESNKSSPTWRTMEQILDSLDISMGEVEYLLKKESQKERIIRKSWSITDNTDTKALHEIINECINYDGNTPIIQDIKILSEVLIDLPNVPNENVNCLSKIKISSIWQRLNSMNLWTLIELKLASCCLFDCSLDTTISISARIGKELEKYKNYQNIEVQCFIVMQYINLCSLYLSNSNIEQAKIMNKKALSLSKKIKRFLHLFLLCTLFQQLAFTCQFL